MRLVRGLSIMVVTAGCLMMSGALMPRAHGLTAPGAGVTHTYYIAADEVDWNYAPMDHDHMTGKPYTKQARRFIDNGPENIGRIYRKAVYREYTDGTFTMLKPRPAEWEHLGVLGPVLRAEVGDTITVLFKNNAKFPFTMHPHGVVYDQASDGMTPIPPGQTFTYTWKVDAQSGPQAGEPSSKMWLYHSHANEQRDTAAGLLGTIIVSEKGTTKPDGTPKDVDREFVAAFYTLNENQSVYLDQNITTYIKDSKDFRKTGAVNRDIDGQPVDVGFAATNTRETINGYLFGNVPGLVMKQGDRVRWYTSGMGPGFHVAHWHGNTVTLDSKSTDVVSALPAEMHTEDMLAGNPGTWMLHCHMENHVAGGMFAHYIVEPNPNWESTRAGR